jgi:hypothetical protein
MDVGSHSLADQVISGSNVLVASNDISGASSVTLRALGEGDSGNVELNANGRVAASVDDSCIDIESGAIVVDGGLKGVVALRTGPPVAMQVIEMQGAGGDVRLANGQLPVSPAIKISPESIELSVGPNKITIDATGVQVSGLKATIEGVAEAEMSAPMVSVKGMAEASMESSGMTTVKGSLVMIN